LLQGQIEIALLRSVLAWLLPAFTRVLHANYTRFHATGISLCKCLSHSHTTHVTVITWWCRQCCHDLITKIIQVYVLYR
jgi:hypothetical protein